MAKEWERTDWLTSCLSFRRDWLFRENIVLSGLKARLLLFFFLKLRKQHEVSICESPSCAAIWNRQICKQCGWISSMQTPRAIYISGFSPSSTISILLPHSPQDQSYTHHLARSWFPQPRMKTVVFIPFLPLKSYFSLLRVNLPWMKYPCPFPTQLYSSQLLRTLKLSPCQSSNIIVWTLFVWWAFWILPNFIPSSDDIFPK
jgi:hypothetical protein